MKKIAFYTGILCLSVLTVLVLSGFAMADDLSTTNTEHEESIATTEPIMLTQTETVQEQEVSVSTADSQDHNQGQVPGNSDSPQEQQSGGSSISLGGDDEELCMGDDTSDCPQNDVQDQVLGDLNGDGMVDGYDLGIVLGQWGECPSEGECFGDLNGDGIVDREDIDIVLNEWTFQPSDDIGVQESDAPGPQQFTNGNPIVEMCSIGWECSEWSLCTNGQKTRTCQQVDSECTVQTARPGETMSCAVLENTETGNTDAVEETEVSTFGITGAVIGGGTKSLIGLIALIVVVGVAYLITVSRKK